MSKQMLEPCPFCGSDNVDFSGAPGKGYHVQCMGCLARSGWGDYGYQAEAKWNTRAPQSSADSAPSASVREALELALSAFHEQGIAERVPVTLGRIERVLASLSAPDLADVLPQAAPAREEVAKKLMEFADLRSWELTDREMAEYLRRADAILALRPAQCQTESAPQTERAVQLEDFVRWVDCWVSNPVGSYSVHALDGLFGMTRDKIGALTRPQAETAPQPPAGYQKLPDGTRCRCPRMWQDGKGGYWCCLVSLTRPSVPGGHSMTYASERVRLLQRAGRELAMRLLPKPFSLWYSDHDTGCQMTIVAKVGTDWQPVWKGSIWYSSRYEFNDSGDVAGLQPEFDFAREVIEKYFGDIVSEVERLSQIRVARKADAELAASLAKQASIDAIRRDVAALTSQERK